MCSALEEYALIRVAIAETRPDLLEKFDSENGTDQMPHKLGEWLDANLPVKDGWGWRSIEGTHRIILNIGDYQ